jgi:hypothetical protein
VMTKYRPLQIKDIAKVTEQGICFKGKRYSCIRAIREQWFETAQICGGWMVQVYFDPSNLKVIYLIDEEEGMEACNMIEIHMSESSKIEKYFRSIQKLKRLRSQSLQSINNKN